MCVVLSITGRHSHTAEICVERRSNMLLALHDGEPTARWSSAWLHAPVDAVWIAKDTRFVTMLESGTITKFRIRAARNRMAVLVNKLVRLICRALGTPINA
jgi:hypothetical protein